MIERMESLVSSETPMLVTSYGVSDQGQMWICRGRCKNVSQRWQSRCSRSSETMIEVET
jgi:hypothetical protein